MFYFHISSALILRVSGKDSARYLNARLTNNIKDLNIGAAVRAAALTPQGRIQAIFSIFRTSSTEFLAIADGGDLTEVTQALGKYIVADRVIISHESNFSLLHVAAELQGYMIESISKLASTFPIQRTLLKGLDCIVENQNLVNFENLLKTLQISKISAQSAREQRFRALLPSFPEELNEALNLMEAGGLDLISDQKGCYTGQEVVEKISAIGKPPRVLAAFSAKGDAEIRPMESILSYNESNHAQPLGRVISVVYSELDKLTHLFALIKPESTSKSISYKVGEVEVSLRHKFS